MLNFTIFVDRNPVFNGIFYVIVCNRNVNALISYTRGNNYIILIDISVEILNPTCGNKK